MLAPAVVAGGGGLGLFLGVLGGLVLGLGRKTMTEHLRLERLLVLAQRRIVVRHRHAEARRQAAFEEARTESARIAWDPILHNPNLPYFLQGVTGLPTHLVWGREDATVPVTAAEPYKAALKNTDVKLTIFDHCGHRPEIEKSAEFVKLVREFMA